MKHIAIFTIFCVAFAAGVFGQDSSVNTIASVGYLYPAPVNVAPGQLITVFVQGNTQGTITATVQQVSGHAAPVIEVRPPTPCILAPTLSSPCSTVTAVTVQIPYEILPTCLLCATPASFNTQMYISVNGAAGGLFALTPLGDQIHILTSCDTVVPSGNGYAQFNGLPCSPLVTHADGSPVSAGSPAAGGEEVVVYAVGLGSTNPAVPTGQAATAATPTNQTFNLDFNFRPNALASKPIPPAAIPEAAIPSDIYFPVYTGLAPGYVGLYQINLIVAQPPAGLQPCSGAVLSNLTVSVGGLNSFDGAGICVTAPVLN